MSKNSNTRISRNDAKKLAALRAALIAGEESGPPAPFDFDAFIAERHQKAAKKRAACRLQP